MARGEVGEVGLAGEDLVAEVEEARGGVGAGGGGDDAAVGVLPGGLAAGALVLDEDVRRPHSLALPCRRRRHADDLAPPPPSSRCGLAVCLCGVGTSAQATNTSSSKTERYFSRSFLSQVLFFSNSK